MHDGMPYDPIQAQGQGASEVPKIALFQVKYPKIKCLSSYSVHTLKMTLVKTVK